LQTVSEVVDLGIKLDSKLTFTSHVSQIVAKAKQRLFLLFRAFRTRDIAPLLTAYRSYVLPIINYGTSVWSPYLLGDIYAVESVQRLFTKRLFRLENLNYSARLVKLGIPSLELLRLRADLLLCFKIIHGIIAGPLENYGLTLSTRNVSRGHNRKLFCGHTRVEARRNFFANRIIRPWNSLPSDVVNAQSSVVFKRLILTCDLGEFLKLDFDIFDRELIDV
jgi:hypothetical protein